MITGEQLQDNDDAAEIDITEEIKITDAMEEAGRAELITFNHDFEDERDAVKRIYLAMRLAERRSRT